MPLHTVYRQNIYIKFYSNLCSRALFFHILFTLSLYVASFFAAYKTHGFYRTTTELLVHPKVDFSYNMSIKLTTVSTANPDPLITGKGNLFWSSIPEQLSLIPPNSLFAPAVTVLKSSKQITPAKSLAMKIHAFTDHHVVGVDMQMFFSYTLASHFNKIPMQSAVLISSNTIRSARKLAIAGNLKLYQRNPLPSITSNTAKFDVSFYPTNPSNLEEFSNDKIAAKISAQNETVLFEETSKVWKLGRIPSKQPFTIELQINYPPVVVKYQSDFWYQIKWAWIQWLGFLVIFLFVYDRIKTLVFQNHIINTVHKCDEVKHLFDKKKHLETFDTVMES